MWLLQEGERVSSDRLFQDTTQACYPHYILVGDNIGKNVSPHDMRVDNQTKSFHYFHSHAVHDRS